MNRADYGFDAPAGPVGLAAVTVLSLGTTVVLPFFVPVWWALIPLAFAVFCAVNCASFVYTTRRGKFVVWRRLLLLHGNERVLDLGCGRGAVLNMAAAAGAHAIGVDIWRTVDQSGNDPLATLRNAAAEGVTVDVLTADMRALPIATASIDVVVSSLAIHNIRGAAGRKAAIAEAVRVLRPGGRLIIADYRHTRTYAAQLTELGLSDVRVQDLGWRYWYGGPWGGRTAAVTASR